MPTWSPASSIYPGDATASTATAASWRRTTSAAPAATSCSSSTPDREPPLTDRRLDPRWTAALWLVIVGVGLALRLPGLTRSLGHDEVYTRVIFASQPWLDIVGSYHLPNNHIFHTLCARAALGLFGEHEWALRLPALLAGLLSLPVLGVVATRLSGSRTVGGVAALLLAVSVIHAGFSQEARGYSLLVLLCLLHAWAFWAAVEQLRPDRRPPDYEAWPWLAAALSGSLAVLTVPSAALFVGAAAIATALQIRLRLPRSRRLRARVPLLLASAACVAVALAVYAPHIEELRAHAARFGTPLTLSTWPAFVADVWTGIAAPRWPAALAVVCALGLLAVGRRRDGHGLYLTLLLLCPLALSLAVATAAEARVYVFLLPWVCVGLAAAADAACQALAPRLPASAHPFLVAALVAPLLAAVGGWPRPLETGYRDAGTWVLQHTEPGDVVVVPYIMDSAIGYYARGATVQRLRDAVGSGPRRLLVLTRPGTPRFDLPDLMLATNIATAGGGYADRYRSWQLPATAFTPLAEPERTRVLTAANPLQPVDLGDLTATASWHLYYASTPDSARWEPTARGAGLQAHVEAGGAAVLHAVRTFRPPTDGLLLLVYGRRGSGYASLFDNTPVAAGAPPQALQMARPISATATVVVAGDTLDAEAGLCPVRAGQELGLYLTVDGGDVTLAHGAVAFLPFTDSAP